MVLDLAFLRQPSRRSGTHAYTARHSYRFFFYSIAVISTNMKLKPNLVRSDSPSLHSARLQLSLRLSLVSMCSTGPQPPILINHSIIVYMQYSFCSSFVDDIDSCTRLYNDIDHIYVALPLSLLLSCIGTPFCSFYRP